MKIRKGLFSNLFLKFYARFVKIRGNAREVALGLALGIFIGMTPTLGAQMILAVFLASLFQWNKISAALGVWITNPFTAPFIYSFNYFLGSKILCLFDPSPRIDPKELHLNFKLIRETPGIFGALFLGGILSGIPSAFLGYQLALNFLKAYRDRMKERIAKRIERAKEKAKEFSQKIHIPKKIIKLKHHEKKEEEKSHEEIDS